MPFVVSEAEKEEMVTESTLYGFIIGKTWQILHYCLTAYTLSSCYMAPKGPDPGLNSDWSKPVMTIAFPFAKY